MADDPRTISPKILDEKVELIRKWLRGGITDKMARQAVEEVLEAHKFKLSVSLVGAAQRTMISILRMMDELDTIESEVYSGIAGADYKDKVKAFRAMSDTMKIRLEFVQKILTADNVTKEKAQHDELHLHLHNPQLDLLKPQQRDNTRQVIKELLASIEKRNEDLPLDSEENGSKED